MKLCSNDVWKVGLFHWNSKADVGSYFKKCQTVFFKLSLRLATFPVDTGRKLNVLCTFNLRPVSTGSASGNSCQLSTKYTPPWFVNISWIVTCYKNFPSGRTQNVNWKILLDGCPTRSASRLHTWTFILSNLYWWSTG